jgi:threonine dehydratase
VILENEQVMINKYKKYIDDAKVYDVAKRTPLDYQALLSIRLNNQIYLKREDLQPVFSFKIRGAYNKLAHLDKKTRDKGIIAASAGNHAQGVAMAAKKLGCKATIVMPKTTPTIKTNAVRKFGAKVVLHGISLYESLEHAHEIEKKQGLTFIHPFDDPYVIAGQGTIGKEILEDFNEPLHAIFVCVGGGGLISGIAAYVKAVNPEIKIIGVEAKDSEAMTEALKKNERISLDQVSLFAEGAAVKQIGVNNFEIASQCVDEMVVVDNDEICAAIKDVFEDTRTILEPAGALAAAGLKSYVQKNNIQGKNLIGTASGANINFDRLRFVAERAELGEQREAILSVTIPEKPGAFKTFCDLLGAREVTEFNYRYCDENNAQIFVGVTISNTDDTKILLKKFNESGLIAYDLTDNEMAKLHLRYMVGGHAPDAKNEMIYRFEFPEKPGALLSFLTNMGENWNISLFHYRNHGADIGRVLIGMQVPKKDQEAFNNFLNTLEYPFVNETDNLGYKMFLGKP